MGGHPNLRKIAEAKAKLQRRREISKRRKQRVRT
jgi:hypothetical protein